MPLPGRRRKPGADLLPERCPHRMSGYCDACAPDVLDPEQMAEYHRQTDGTEPPGQGTATFDRAALYDQETGRPIPAVPADPRGVSFEVWMGDSDDPDRGDAWRAANPLADSGDRTEQYGGAIRDRAPGKGRYDLLSPTFMRELALLAEVGAEKYTRRDASGAIEVTGARNWERGYSLPLCIDSALRHTQQLLAGDDDENHAVQAAWNLMAFIHNRDLIKRGLLPVDLADYTPLHTVNPVTGLTNHGDGPEPTYNEATRTVLDPSLIMCGWCDAFIERDGDAWVTGDGDLGSVCGVSPNRLHRPAR